MIEKINHINQFYQTVLSFLAKSKTYVYYTNNKQESDYLTEIDAIVEKIMK